MRSNDKLNNNSTAPLGVFAQFLWATECLLAITALGSVRGGLVVNVKGPHGLLCSAPEVQVRFSLMLA